MDTFSGANELNPSFCIGQHESRRSLPVTPEIVQQAQAHNYDLLTTPITTPHFHSRVLTLLSCHLSSIHPVSYDPNRTLGTSPNTNPLIIPPLTPEDSPLTPNEGISQLMAVCSPWIDLCSPDPLIADVSRQILTLEIAYAAFCGVSYVVVPGPRLHYGNLQSEGLMYYARAIQEIINVGPYIQIHIWLRMTDQPEMETEDMGDLAPFAREEFVRELEYEQYPKVDLFGTWDAWDAIRKMCKYHSRLFVALSLPKHLPPMPVQTRWHSEPVHLLTIDGTSFVKNAKGYPVLSKAHQGLITRHMRLRLAPWILLCDVGPVPGLDVMQGFNASADSPGGTSFPSLSEASQTQNKKNYDPTPHLSYMRNLQQKQPPRTALERFGIGYQDYLQAPLQPLTVNLESITYEVFEKDPIKYAWYEKAVAKALKDWAEQKKPTSSPDGRVVVAVVGAGRGPLVTRALRASAETGVPIEMWAVEKNQNAYVLLQRHNQHTWGGAVSLIKSDMRSWKGPSRAIIPTPQAINPENAGEGDPPSPPAPEIVHTPIDILISELLGSFGDNELSPECLDGVTHLLNPVHGISIPASYTAHFTPIAAPRLHADVVAQTVANAAAPETPYVVMLHAIDYLSTTNQSGSATSSGVKSPAPITEPPTPNVQTAWSFSHPNPNIPEPSLSSSTISNSHNVRRTRLSFFCRNRGVCHGLGGYFETVLYGDVELSTNPVTMEAKSPGMISWFPIYFPLKTPLYIPDNGQVDVTMYRQTDDRKVWYEWIVEVFCWEKKPAISHRPHGSTSQSPSGLAASVDEKSGSEGGKGKAKGRGREAQIGGGDGSGANTPELSSGMKKVRVGMSELHSSIKDGCLM
ncbi:methyltransferase protein [Arachnomyces sp. PD_36]|nr:methyltransferase protein [Arachnomyces sp. PD_36]